MKTETKNTTKTVGTQEVKRDSKLLVVAGVNFILALISVYAFGFWWDYLAPLENLQKFLNIGVAVMTMTTYFVAKTYYSKGTMNNIKKIFIVLFLAVLTVSLLLLSLNKFTDIIYPFAGILIVSVAFYMVSLAAETLTLLGIVAFVMLFGMLITGGLMFEHINTDSAIMWSKIGVLFVLLIGGVFAILRRYAHGVQGVNADGGFGSSEAGDTGDGDGDTGAE